MKYQVQVNRSQFDAMPVVVLPVDPKTREDVIPVGSDVHVFTPEQLRARDERIIRAAIGTAVAEMWEAGYVPGRRIDFDAIITQADGADQ